MTISASTTILWWYINAGHILRSFVSPRWKRNFHFNLAVAEGIIWGCATWFFFHHHFFLSSRIFPYFACIFTSAEIAPELKTSKSGNLSMCVQGTQDHCSPDADASKILPSQELENLKEKPESRHSSLSFCINGQIIRTSLFLCTMFYVTSDSVVF